MLDGRKNAPGSRRARWHLCCVMIYLIECVRGVSSECAIYMIHDARSHVSRSIAHRGNGTICVRTNALIE